MSMFEIFYTDTADIIERTETGSYDVTVTYELLGSLKGDLQPYTNARMVQDYGLTEDMFGFKLDCRKRLFCANNDILQPGRLARVNGTVYRIIHVADWSAPAFAESVTGAEVLLGAWEGELPEDFDADSDAESDEESDADSDEETEDGDG